MIFIVTPGFYGVSSFLSYIVVMTMPIASMLIVNHVTASLDTPEHSRDIKMGRLSVANRGHANTFPSNFLQIQSKSRHETASEGARDIIISVEQETYRSSVSHTNLHGPSGVHSNADEDVKQSHLDLTEEDSEHQTQTSDDEKGFDDDGIHPFPHPRVAMAVDFQSRAERGDL
ncbi:hypothetical protein FRB94_008714 [Tulasnella sp. JGI-2019a]|nr:hypothetical protein FRB94_008714 [Tulasnella sp. JGI-2019a]